MYPSVLHVELKQLFVRENIKFKLHISNHMLFVLGTVDITTNLISVLLINFGDMSNNVVIILLTIYIFILLRQRGTSFVWSEAEFLFEKKR